MLEPTTKPTDSVVSMAWKGERGSRSQLIFVPVFGSLGIEKHYCWWFQIFFIISPTWGNDPIWRAYFSNGLKPPTRLPGLKFPRPGKLTYPDAQMYWAHHSDLVLRSTPNGGFYQWSFLVPLIGGRWYISPQLAVYTTYIPLIYCLLGDYMLPTTH